MTTCAEIGERISALYDGELNAEEETLAKEHLAECSDCRSLLELYAQITEEFSAEGTAAPDTLVPGVMARIRSDKKKRRNRWITAGACAAACLVLVIFAGPWNWRAGSAGSKADMAVPESVEAVPAEAAGAVSDEGNWDVAESKNAAYDAYDSLDTDEMETVAEEAADDYAPQADVADPLLRDYAAVITVYGDIPESVTMLSEAEKEMPDGTAWLIPSEKADELEKALEDAEAYEWLTGNGETSSWLLVRAAEN